MQTDKVYHRKERKISYRMEYLVNLYKFFPGFDPSSAGLYITQGKFVQKDANRAKIRTV